MSAHGRVAAAAMVLVALVGCSGGVNAGEEGGIAFIVFTGMLLATGFILWLVLGRDE